MDKDNFYGEPLLDFTASTPWWPRHREFQIHEGGAGHDRELVLNIDGYGPRSFDNEFIPDLVVEALVACLPKSWLVQSRGTRVEVHPSGHFAGGFTPEDTDTLRSAVEYILS